MDTLHGQDGVGGDDPYDYGENEAPPVISANERRMHVRAYNHWASLLGNRALPSIEDLIPEQLEDFSPQSVLLDFSMGVDNPAIIYLGSALREECGISGHVERTSEVPARSLLSRLTDHYLQIIANAAPVGFEAEFTNQRGAEILYRGILMPFSSDDQTIDFIYGVVSWKEVADQGMSDSLIAEVEQALQGAPSAYPAAPIWADGPLITDDMDASDPTAQLLSELGIAGSPKVLDELDELDLGEYAHDDTDGLEALPDLGKGVDDKNGAEADQILDLTDFASIDDDDLTSLPEVDELDENTAETAPKFAVVADDANGQDLADVLDLSETDHDLGDVLDLARQSAADARECDTRGRTALYRAISHAYDFALAARNVPDDYAALLERAAITVQDRSPMTAIIKLVFGAEYDKTRIAEYAAVLDYAFSQQMTHGTLARQLAFYSGGLKGLVQDVRAARQAGEVRPSRRLEIARLRLAKAKPIAIPDIAVDADGLTVAVIRREADGTLTVLGTLDTQEKSAQQVIIETMRTKNDQ
ncbi:MAG: hypothetical protein ABI395_02345 [Sphingobium sp.]